MENEPRATLYGITCLLFVLVSIGVILVIIDALSKFY